VRRGEEERGGRRGEERPQQRREESDTHLLSAGTRSAAFTTTNA